MPRRLSMFDCNEPAPNSVGNPRSVKGKKTLKGDFGQLTIDVSRGRQSSVESQIIPQIRPCWTGFEGKIVLHPLSRMTMREVQSCLEDTCDTELSPMLISSAVKTVVQEVFVLAESN